MQIIARYFSPYHQCGSCMEADVQSDLIHVLTAGRGLATYCTSTPQ